MNLAKFKRIRCKILIVACLPILQSGCTRNDDQQDRQNAIVLRALSAQISYSKLANLNRNQSIDKRHLKAVVALARRFGGTASLELAEIAWLQALSEAKRIYGFDSKDYITIVHEVGSFYEGKLHFDKAEKLYREDLEARLAAIANSKKGIVNRTESGNSFDATEPSPEEARALSEDMISIANILDRHNPSPEAIDLKRKAIALQRLVGVDTDPFWQNTLAHSLSGSDFYAESKKAYLRIFELTNDNGWYYSTNLGLARLEAKCKNFDAAIQYYKKGLDFCIKSQIWSDYADIELELGRVYRSCGMFDEAADCFKNCISCFETRKMALKETYCAALYELAEVYSAQNKINDCKSTVEKSVTLFRQNSSIQKNYASISLRVLADYENRQHHEKQSEMYASQANTLASEFALRRKQRAP